MMSPEIALVTLFGLFLLSHLVRFVPGHYVRMVGRVLEMLQQQMVR